MRTFAHAMVTTATVLILLSGASSVAGTAERPILTPEPLDGEVCGNCADDDDDGLVDIEDPDCCPSLGTLDMRRVRTASDRLTLRALLPQGLDPRGHELRLVVSRQTGPLVCREVAPPPAHRRGRGASQPRLHPARGGRWALEAVAPLDQHVIGAMRVTLRVGERCLGSIAIVEPRHGRLLP